MTRRAQQAGRAWNTLLALGTTVGLITAVPGTAGAGASERDPVEMVRIPAGPFLMGNPAGVGRRDEQPRRKIHVDSFFIDTHEVTNARYLNFVRQTGHRHPPDPYGDGELTSAKGIERLPVVQVNWYDAVEYCHWAGKRLPREAEWEKAARGTDGRLFPWGNDTATAAQANFDREWVGKETLHPVGSLPAGRSPYGVEDMSGNAREWVQDWYKPDYYEKAPDRNPKGPDRGVLRVIRGGSWHSPIADIRATARGKGGFALRTHGTGFRCAADARSGSLNTRSTP